MPSVALVNASARTDGISFDARALHVALKEIGYRVVWYQCADRGVDSRLPEQDWTVPGLGVPNGTLDMGINRLWIFPRRLRRVPGDILLMMDPTLINIARSHGRTVVRVHDLKPLTPFAERRAATWMFRFAVPRLRFARRILVYSADMIAELEPWGVSPERVRVVPGTHSLGFHPNHIESSLQRIQTTGVLRALYVATDRPYKNLPFLLRLAEAFARDSGRVRVEFTLLSRLGPQTSAMVSRLKLPNLTVIPAVSSVAEVYAANDVLVFPSLHEGFGRPIIEAMAFGMPVVASSIPPIQEIAGDSGFLLDPGAVEPWVRVLLKLAEPKPYEEAARRSFARGGDYSPARFRDAVAHAFEDL